MAPHFYLMSSISIWFPPVVMMILVVTDLLIFHFAIPESKGKPIADKMPENHERFKIFADNGSLTSFINKLSLSKSSSRKSFGIGQELDNSIVE
ncbi:unnamed protein product, partial [Mesorhabditis belari]|uniref:Uncharacterized protein n=1 Tax=Mesorhabditis belari TaxID=2138241 RepID=A0AAF3EAN4_9BILA